MENRLEIYIVTTDFPAIYELVYVKQCSYGIIGKPHCLDIGSINKKVNYCRIWGFHSGGYEEYHLLGYDAA
jgi:hypothetical protein